MLSLVAALRAVLADPELAGVGVQRGALRVAMADAPDAWAARPGAPDAGCRARQAAVAVDAHHLAQGLLGHVLRRRLPSWRSPRVMKRVLSRAEHQARTVSARTAARPWAAGGTARWPPRCSRLLALQPRHAPRRCRCRRLPALGVAPVDEGLAAGEVRVHRHIEQARPGRPLATAGRPLSSRRRRGVGAQQPEAADFFGQQPAPIGQAGQAPRGWLKSLRRVLRLRSPAAGPRPRGGAGGAGGGAGAGEGAGAGALPPPPLSSKAASKSAAESLEGVLACSQSRQRRPRPGSVRTGFPLAERPTKPARLPCTAVHRSKRENAGWPT